jgi:hypothetical protein
MSQDGSGRDLHVGQKLAAGSISGGIGAVLTTPIELAKTRLQVCCGYVFVVLLPVLLVGAVMTKPNELARSWLKVQ